MSTPFPLSRDKDSPLPDTVFSLLKGMGAELKQVYV